MNPVLGRLKWALSAHRKPKTLVGHLRLLWHDFIIHPLFGGGERCQDCGRSYVLWWTDDESLWQQANDGSLGGLLCPLCFAKRLDANGIVVRFAPTVIKQRKQ